MKDDVISRQAAIDILDAYQVMVENGEEKPYEWARLRMSELPSVQPYTDEEIQKIQELEQAQLDKAFELGKESAKAEIIHCGECKHADYARKDVLGRIYCLNHGFYWDALAYCSYAERKTDGEIIPE